MDHAFPHWRPPVSLDLHLDAEPFTGDQRTTDTRRPRRAPPCTSQDSERRDESGSQPFSSVPPTRHPDTRSPPPPCHEETGSVPPTRHPDTRSPPPPCHEETGSVPPTHHPDTRSPPPPCREDTGSVPPTHHPDTMSPPPPCREDTGSVPPTRHPDTTIPPPSCREETGSVPPTRHPDTMSPPPPCREETGSVPPTRHPDTTIPPPSRREETGSVPPTRHPDTTIPPPSRREETGSVPPTRHPDTMSPPPPCREETGSVPPTRHPDTTIPPPSRREETGSVPPTRHPDTTIPPPSRREETGSVPPTRHPDTTNPPPSRREESGSVPPTRHPDTMSPPLSRREETGSVPTNHHLSFREETGCVPGLPLGASVMTKGPEIHPWDSEGIDWNPDIHKLGDGSKGFISYDTSYSQSDPNLPVKMKSAEDERVEGVSPEMLMVCNKGTVNYVDQRSYHSANPDRSGHSGDQAGSPRSPCCHLLSADAALPTDDLTGGGSPEGQIHSGTLRQAADVLAGAGLVLLSGPRGSGKGRLGRALLALFGARGYRPLLCSSARCCCLHALLSRGARPSVVLLTGGLGDVRLDTEQLDNLTALLGAASASAEARTSSSSSSSSPLSSSSSSSPSASTSMGEQPSVSARCLVIVPTLPHVLHELLELVDSSGSRPLWGRSLVVDLTLCPLDPGRPFQTGVATFAPLLHKMLRHPATGTTAAALLALGMLGRRAFPVRGASQDEVRSELSGLGLHGAADVRELNRSAASFRGSLLAPEGPGFASRAGYDAAGLALARFDLALALAVCDARFLVQHVRLAASPPPPPPTPRQTALLVVCGPEDRPLLTDKLCRLIEQGEGRELSQHPEFRAEGFWEELLALRVATKGDSLNAATAKAKARAGTQHSSANSPGGGGGGSGDFHRALDRLHAASLAGDDWSVVELLCCHGDPASLVRGRQGPSGDTPLHVACGAGRGRVASLLVASGADINARNRLELTPLHSACAGDHADAARRLVDWGADVNARGACSRTPLHVACREGHVAVVDLLLGCGADLGGRCGREVSPLHEAVTRGHAALVDLLLARGSEVNAKDALGLSPLHAAVRANDLHVTRLLLRGGANARAKNERGFSPVDEARLRGHRALLRVLLHHHRRHQHPQLAVEDSSSSDEGPNRPRRRRQRGDEVGGPCVDVSVSLCSRPCPFPLWPRQGIRNV